MESLSDYNRKNGFENWNDTSHPLADTGVYIRWTRFIPQFHKYSGEVCSGFQLHPVPGSQYHALAHNLRIIRFTKENCDEFSFRPGKYESGNDKRAIELLCGDPLLVDYLEGKENWDNIKEEMKHEEQKWIRKAKRVRV